VFATRRKGNLFTTGPDRWLVLAGAGLLVLGLVLRLLTDIGRSTATGDTATPMADTQQPALEPAPSTALPPTTAETLAATPPVPAPAPRSAANLEVGRKLVPVIEQPAPIPRAGDWGVQLGAFSKRANAERLAAQVRQLGYQSSVAPSGSLSRVRVTGLANRATAQLAADSIAGALGTKGVVVGPAR
jgi:cell division septation protein DedD